MVWATSNACADRCDRGTVAKWYMRYYNTIRAESARTMSSNFCVVWCIPILAHMSGVNFEIHNLNASPMVSSFFSLPSLYYLHNIIILPISKIYLLWLNWVMLHVVSGLKWWRASSDWGSFVWDDPWWLFHPKEHCLNMTESHDVKHWNTVS